MPIHDQSYRRYGGERAPEGRAWTGLIATAGIKTMLAKREFLGLLLIAWLPFIVRAVQMYIAANCPQATMLAPTAETFRQFLEQQGVFTFFITIFTGAGLTRERPAGERPANLPVEAPGRFEDIAGKFGVPAFFLRPVTWPPATTPLIIQIVFAGNLAFLKANLFLLPAILVTTGIETIVLCMVRSLVLLALEERAVCRQHHVCRHGLLHARALRRSLRGDAQYEVLLDVAPGQHPAPRRSGVPGDAAIRHAGVGHPAGPGRHRRRADFVLERRVRGVEVVTCAPRRGG